MRMIDADLVIERLGHDMQQMEDPVFMMMIAAVISDIRHAPTIDEVPVDLINRIIEADGTEDQNASTVLLSLLDTWKHVKRKEGEK